MKSLTVYTLSLAALVIAAIAIAGCAVTRDSGAATQAQATGNAPSQPSPMSIPF